MRTWKQVIKGGCKIVPNYFKVSYRLAKKTIHLFPEFDSIDQNGSGQILFSEFIDWALAKNLDLEDEEDPEEGADAEPAEAGEGGEGEEKEEEAAAE